MVTPLNVGEIIFFSSTNTPQGKCVVQKPVEHLLQECGITTP